MKHLPCPAVWSTGSRNRRRRRCQTGNVGRRRAGGGASLILPGEARPHPVNFRFHFSNSQFATTVIASEAKQSILPHEEKLDCFVANAPRNDGFLISSANPRSRGRNAPSRANHSPKEKQRAWGTPGAQCTRSLACNKQKAHERRHHRSTALTRRSHTRWF